MRSNFFLLVGLCFIMISCQAQNSSAVKDQIQSTTTIIPAEYENEQLVKVEKTEKEWKAELSDQEYNILREAGTERSFSGDLWDNKAKGTYTCRACSLPLFSSTTKFKSGTGWPSYYQPIKEDYVREESDTKYGWNRVEVLCGRCDGHLGHVFDDGPKPTGLRYCINSYSLDFVQDTP